MFAAIGALVSSFRHVGGESIGPATETPPHSLDIPSDVPALIGSQLSRVTSSRDSIREEQSAMYCRWTQYRYETPDGVIDGLVSALFPEVKRSGPY